MESECSDILIRVKSKRFQDVCLKDLYLVEDVAEGRVDIKFWDLISERSLGYRVVLILQLGW